MPNTTQYIIGNKSVNINDLYNQFKTTKDKNRAILNDLLLKLEKRLYSRGKFPSFILSGVGHFYWSDHPEMQTFTFTPENKETN